MGANQILVNVSKLWIVSRVKHMNLTRTTIHVLLNNMRMNFITLPKFNVVGLYLPSINEWQLPSPINLYVVDKIGRLVVHIIHQSNKYQVYIGHVLSHNILVHIDCGPKSLSCLAGLPPQCHLFLCTLWTILALSTPFNSNVKEDKNNLAMGLHPI